MPASTLQLQVKETPNLTAVFSVGDQTVAMVCPPVDEDYWIFRVPLTETQAVIGFGKFGSVGIGFAVEEDWNTNLPTSVHTEDIFAHIARNKGDDSIDDDDVREAIRMIQRAAATYQRREIRQDDNGDVQVATVGGRFTERTPSR